jgi:hypothetical protein
MGKSKMNNPKNLEKYTIKEIIELFLLHRHLSVVSLLSEYLHARRDKICNQINSVRLSYFILMSVLIAPSVFSNVDLLHNNVEPCTNRVKIHFI